MIGKVIFRMDDICPDMNYEKFSRARDIFIQFGIKPLLGIVPCNKDLKLKEKRREGKIYSDKSIWEELYRLNHIFHWDIALHGFEHKYLTNDSGILKINNKSEFAGVPYELQVDRIFKGKEKLQGYGLNPITFMAPSHSFDKNTLIALKECGIRSVTDGQGIFPYVEGNIIFMPVPYSLFWHFPIGIYTICLHTNTMNEKDFKKLSLFLKKYSNRCLSFSDAIALLQNHKQKQWVKVINFLADIYMKIVLKIVLGISRIKKVIKK